MRMKKILYVIMVLALVSCADQLTMEEEVLVEKTEMTSTNEIQTLLERGKWGDGNAYLQLANCYRDGKGVKRDFIGMLTMASLAEDYKGIFQMREYLDSLPKDSEYKLFIDCVEKFEQKQTEEAHALLERIATNDTPDGYAIQGIAVLEHGDTIEAKRLFEYATEKGSNFAELLLCIPDWRSELYPSIERLAALTDKIPWINNLLAKIYAGKKGYNIKDDKMTAYYYLKADKQACLSKEGAQWLLNYLRDNGDLDVTPSDVERFQILADEYLVVEVDTIITP